ncbi:MAG: putative RND superfamily exporter protein [Parvibaculaceae bacterium]|jgi:predicted RND superfamily exporter protein
MQSLSSHASQHSKRWFSVVGFLSLLLLALVALPTLSPTTFPFLNALHIDTDPENMLSETEPVRLFHNEMKKEFGLYDMIVVGVVNETNPQGVFNVETLNDVVQLTDFAKKIGWDENGVRHGVIAADVMAPSTVDNIEQAGVGTVRFEWLMKQPATTQAEALAIAQKAQRIPFLNNTLISDDGKSLALYIPITAKKDSYKIAEMLKAEISTFKGTDTYHITGLPIAQDQFGIEMFKQMAISAPLAMLLIFALMWYFFRHLNLIIAPMVVALVAVIGTMGLLIITGNTVHIMSSMIPIFIMPIAVLDAVHILSDFFDKYPHSKNRTTALREVMKELSKPMLFTSLTTCAGFASLAFTPIPPVQVFGVFIAIGVALAWFLTITLVPAYIMLLPEKSLLGFGMGSTNEAGGVPKLSLMGRGLLRLGGFTFTHAKLILGITLVLSGVAYYGITKIQINDNPVKWFEANHPIRIADQALNERFAGTYMAYLTFEAVDDDLDVLTPSIIDDFASNVQADLQPLLGSPLSAVEEKLIGFQDDAASDEEWEAWEAALVTLQNVQQQRSTFKRPDVLAYIEGLQAYLLETGLVGKSNTLPDIVKTVHRELFLGEEEAYRIPDTQNAVAQTLLTYQGSHRPQDLWHFVTPDYRKTNLWIQLKSGDNKDMAAVIEAVDGYVEAHPAPTALAHKWFGLTYINVVWQQRMVAGMLDAFVGSFVIVLVMMVFLFRSFWWGLLSMVPLSLTIGLIYGVIGLIGKDYDMPVAVLSALSLGLAVDYAIHFLVRSREIRQRYQNWQMSVKEVFGEPGRAIARNVIVIGIGFTPLLAAPLVPYQTVGIFISAILVIAGAGSLLILPALITLFETTLFKASKEGTS